MAATDYAKEIKGAGHLLHWNVMQSLKAKGVTLCNMGRLAQPSDRNFSAKLAGIAQFKTGFCTPTDVPCATYEAPKYELPLAWDQLMNEYF